MFQANYLKIKIKIKSSLKGQFSPKSHTDFHLAFCSESADTPNQYQRTLPQVACVSSKKLHLNTPQPACSKRGNDSPHHQVTVVCVSRSKKGLFWTADIKTVVMMKMHFFDSNF